MDQQTNDYLEALSAGLTAVAGAITSQKRLDDPLVEALLERLERAGDAAMDKPVVASFLLQLATHVRNGLDTRNP